MQGDPSSGGDGEERGKWLPPEPPGKRSDIDPAPGAGPPQSPAAPQPGPGPQSPAGPQSPTGPQPQSGPQSPGAPQGPPAGASPPPPYGAQPPAAYAPPPYAGQGHAGPGPGPQPGQLEPGNGSAVAALVLGIVSLALLLVSAGFSTIISLGCAVPAIFLGRKGRRLVDEGQVRKHRGLAQAGFIMGIVGTVLSVLATVFWVLIIALSEDFQQGFDEGFDQNFDQSSIRLLAARAAASAGRLLLG